MLKESLEELLSEPVSSVKERERITLERLLEQRRDKVVLFGAGNLGRRSLACLRRIGVAPLALSDNNANLWGTEVEGVPVLEPAIAAQRFGSEAVFIVTIWNTQHRFADTHRQLERLGCDIVAPGAPVFWYFADDFLPSFCQDLPHKVYEDAVNVQKAANIWADQSSKSLYLNQIRWRTLGDYDCLSAPAVPETYFPEMVNYLSEEIFVDCGAFNGDTIQDFIARRNAGFKAVTAIEADIHNFSKLESYVDSLSVDARHKITLLHRAVGAEPGLIRFDDTGGVNSRVSQEGTVFVPCVSLDELFKTTSLTYLKMDIEGAEFDALRGAQTVIQRDRPVLAICVYHRQNDLWTLPLLIKEMVPEYKMYLRMYETEGSQTVAYAIPPERVLNEHS